MIKLPLYKINTPKLRDLMTTQGWKISGLCSLLNFNVDVFKKYYSGQASLLFRREIESIARVLKVDWQELIRGEYSED